MTLFGGRADDPSGEAAGGPGDSAWRDHHDRDHDDRDHDDEEDRMDNVMTLDGGTGHCRLAAGIDSRSKEPQPAAVATVSLSGEKVENLVQAFDQRGNCVKASRRDPCAAARLL
jgi:hypothetical protein